MQRKKALQGALGTPGGTVDAAARRDLARHDHLQRLRECPGHLVIGLVSERWATLIVEALAEGPRRHSELRRHVPGATQKMLTQTLRNLERDGLLTRRVEPVVPVRVEYALTSLGHHFLDLQRDIYNWATAHADEIRSARVAFDHDRQREAQSVPEMNRRRQGLAGGSHDS